LTPWGGLLTYQSCFKTSYLTDRSGVRLFCQSLADSAFRYSNFNTRKSLKTCTAIDYHFPAVNRYQDTILVQFDALWDTLVTIGEGGRIVVALLHGLPSSPFTAGLVDSVNMAAPFGRPAYNFRMLSKLPATNRGGLYMFYGGGQSVQGEVEKYSDRTAGNFWWLPGFIAQPGGTSPGTGGEYPIGPCYTNYSPLASTTNWQRITMRVAPERIDMWMRKTSDSALPGYGNSIVRMAIPRTDRGNAYVLSQMNATHGSNVSTPPLLYNWFPTVSGLRLYYRANYDVGIANIKVLATAHTTSLAGTHKKDAINPFPNPSTGVVMVNPDLEGKTVSIVNGLGQKVMLTAVKQTAVDLSTLPKGIYQIYAGESKSSIVIQ